MALPNDKISVSLVASELVVSETDVGKLCTHNAINKWSKWKPVRFNKVTGLTEGELRSVNCGLLVYPATADYTVLIPSAIMWFYEKPRGVNVYTEPYRLGDFRNYNHEGNPVVSIPSSSIKVNKAVNPSLNMEINLVTYATMPMDDPSIMRIEDIDISIGSLYYAIVFEWLGQTYIKTASNTIGNYYRTINFNFNTEYPLPQMSPQALVFYNVLSDTLVTTLTLLNDVESTVLFSPLPLSDDANNKVSVILTDESGIILTPIKIAGIQIGVGLNDFIDIPYYEIHTPLIAKDGFCIRVRVQNTTSNNINLPVAGWEMQVNPTYWGANTNYFACDLRDENGAIMFGVTQVDIPANDSVILSLWTSNALIRNGTTPVTVTTKMSTVASIFFRNGMYTGNTSLHATSME